MILVVLLAFVAIACVGGAPSFLRKYGVKAAWVVSLLGLCFGLATLGVAIWGM